MKAAVKIKPVRLIGKLFLTDIAWLILFSCNRQVSVSPPDAPPPNGYIYISTNPEGFQIYLDGKERRRVTPDSLTWLTSGTHLITLKKNLYKDTSFTVNIVEGVKGKKFIDLTDNYSMLGSIYCESNPGGAEILLNDSSTGAVTPVTIKNVLPGNYYVRFHKKNYQDDSVNVTISSGNEASAYVFLIDTTLWRYYTTKNSGIKTDDLTCVGVGKNDVIWVGTNDLVALSFNGSTWGGTFLSGAIGDVRVNCIAVNNEQTVFIGSDGGFITTDGSQLNTRIYGWPHHLPAILPSLFINAISFDNTGNWYFATQGGLGKSSLVNGTRTWYTYPDSIVPYTQITCVLYDNSGNLWVGIYTGGLYEITNNNRQWFNQSDVGFINNNVRTIVQSPTGEIWVGFDTRQTYLSGLSYYDGRSWHTVMVTPHFSQTNAILIDKNNTKWVATDQGLVKFTSASDFTVFNRNNTNLNINDVTGIAQDSKGNIWLSTNGGGLVEYKGDR